MQTVKEILEETGLNFHISKRELSDSLNNPSGFFGLYNDSLNKCIGSVKKDYRVSQNEEVVDLVVAGTRQFDVDFSVKKGGSLNDGKKIYLQLEVGGESANVQGDQIKKYITIIDSNDGSTALSIGIGDLTMSCQNQFYKFYKMGQSKLRHNSSLELRIKEIPKLIEMSLEMSFRQIELYNKLSEKSIHRDLAHKMVKELLQFDRLTSDPRELKTLSTRSTNIMENLYECIDVEMNSKGNTLWGLHSGVTRFTTHKLSVPTRDNGREESLLIGKGYKMNQQSLKFAEEHLVLS